MENALNNNQNNPSGIWQGIWAKLFLEILELLTQKEYYHTFESLKKLRAMLPPECEKEVAKEFEETEKIIFKKVEATTAYFAATGKKTQLYKEAPNALLNLVGSIRTSLFNHNWINKNFNISPINRNTPHIKSDS